MKKNNNLGFMLTETLIVSTFVTASLLYMFIQFRVIYQNYNRTFSYNTVNSLYSVNQIRKYISDVDFTIVEQEFIGSNQQYLELTSCPAHLFLEDEYCKKLFEALDVKRVYFTFDDISNLSDAMKKSDYIPEETITFLDYINYQKHMPGYRLIVYFNNETHATLDFVMEE